MPSIVIQKTVRPKASHIKNNISLFSLTLSDSMTISITINNH